MTTLVTCPNPPCHHRFPVNPQKHRNRRERHCPHCKTPIKVKGRLGKFLPNPHWQEQKLKQQADRVWSKEIRKRQPKEPMPMLRSIPEGILALSMLIRKRAMELKEEQAKKEVKKP